MPKALLQGFQDNQYAWVTLMGSFMGLIRASSNEARV